MTKTEILYWLGEYRTKKDIQEVIRWLNDAYDFGICLVLTKAELVDQLGSGGPSKARLLEAIDVALGVGELEIREELEPEDDEEESEENWYDGVEEDDRENLRKQLASEIAFSREHHEQGLRDYQQEGKRVILKKLDPNQAILLHLATGGGKTRVANDVVVETVKKKGWVLWLAPTWELLFQAARDIARRHRGYANRLGRVGGDCYKLPGVFKEYRGKKVLYTTTSTFIRRVASGEFRHLKPPALVVWDECHLGETQKTGRVLFDRRRWRDTPILGLTATPRALGADSQFKVVFSKTFKELCDEKHLAFPIPHMEETHITWVPRFHGQGLHRLLNSESLVELAKNQKRNQLIIDHYEKNSAKYGKTLVFACSVSHADELARMFSDQLGVPARPVSYCLTPQENQTFLRDFRNNSLVVLTNMAKLTHGVDIPDIETVFLCRPTESDILFSQMIGRGCRRVEEIGKVSFHIVEFTDNVERHGDVLWTAKRFFGGAGTPGLRGEASAYKPVERVAKHGFDPTGKPAWIPDRDGVTEALRGLWYRQDQTFGIEFELTRGDFTSRMSEAAWREVAETVRKGLAQRLGDRVATKCFRDPRAVSDHRRWNVVYDGSCGWEVTSRILKNREGFEEVVEACQALDTIMANNRLKVSYRTGTHIHLGWIGKDVAELVRAVRLARLFEPALATLVAPSRVAMFDGSSYKPAEPNAYCRPVSSVITEKKLQGVRRISDFWRLLDPDGGRYTTFNIAPMETIHTVEVRFHGGTVDAKKILLWLSLWQQILWSASVKKNVEIVPDRKVLRPDGDILDLVKRYLPPCQQPLFLERIERRRQEIVDLWRGAAELKSWMLLSKKWNRSS